LLGANGRGLARQRHTRRHTDRADEQHDENQASHEFLHGRVHFTSHTQEKNGSGVLGSAIQVLVLGSRFWVLGSRVRVLFPGSDSVPVLRTHQGHPEKTTDYTRNSFTRSSACHPRIRSGRAIPPVRKIRIPSSTVMSGNVARLRSATTISPRYRWFVGT